MVDSAVNENQLSLCSIILYMAVTIRDVADLARVSMKTVSRVINQEPHVSKAVQLKVMECIRSLGYAPNISARRLATQKSFSICLLMYPGFFSNSPGLLHVIMDLGYETNYDILLQPYYPTHQRSRNRLVKLVGEQRIDGFVTTPPSDHGNFVSDLLTTYRIPLVQINPSQITPPIPCILGGDRTGAILATRHLLELGHTDIACLTGPLNMRASGERLDGFQEAMRASGLTVPSLWIMDSAYTFAGGYTAAKLLLGGERKPTAVFGGNDDSALGVLYAAREMGYKVPEDLSIVGYDDLATAASTWPGLTTVHQPGEEMLSKAVRILIALLAGSQDIPPVSTVTPQLIVRGTTAGPGIKTNPVS